MPGSAQPTVVVTARALIVHNDKLLLVRNDGSFWYTPGGCLEPGEDLISCIAREVFEETGMRVTTTELLHIAEFFETDSARHKVECYFRATVENAELNDDWNDVGPVQQRRFFSLDELNGTLNVQPAFLKRGAWRKTATADPIYQGFERRSLQ